MWIRLQQFIILSRITFFIYLIQSESLAIADTLKKFNLHFMAFFRELAFKTITFFLKILVINFKDYFDLGENVNFLYAKNFFLY